jgi:hypothetical protein
MDDLGARQILKYWFNNKVAVKGIIYLELQNNSILQTTIKFLRVFQK